MSSNELLNDIYYDVDTGYSSITKTDEDAKAKHNTITYEDVKAWMNKQSNKQIRPYKSFNSWVAPYARFEYQIDIMDMNNLKYDYRYAIIVIYAFSKLADDEHMHNKHTNTAYQNLFKTIKGWFSFNYL